MAIVKMKKLRLVAVRSEKDELLKKLMLLGCVQLGEVEGAEEHSLKRETSALLQLKSTHAQLTHAVELLDKYAPAKKKLLSAKPELEDESLLSGEGIDAALELAGKISAADESVRRMNAEESRQRALIESLEPWLPWDVPLETERTQSCSVLTGMIPSEFELGAVIAALSETVDEAELFPVNEDKNMHYVGLVCLKDRESEVLECLRAFGFAASAVSGLSGTARENTEAAVTELARLMTAVEESTQQITALADGREELQLACDRVKTQIDRAEAEEKLLGTESSLVMQGWIPEDAEDELAAALEDFACAWETEEPDEEEYPEVPVQLRNNKLTNAMNMVTEMYSLPAYGTLDPNPLMAPFFILFYGLMMADMGYGLLMIVAALVAMKKIKPRGGTLSFCQLLLYGGISTFVVGILTGSFFADLPLRIAQMINPETTWTGLWHLFDPTTDSIVIMLAAMGLGLIHLNTGMIVSFVQKWKKGDKLGAIFGEGSLWVVLFGGIFLALGILVVKSEALKAVGIGVMCVGGAMMVYDAVREKKGILNMLLGVLVMIYNQVTGWFGDILSYSRIMALMLAGSVIGNVFNTIASITGNIVVFVVVFLIGHALNFGLNLLGCYVHDMRLQVLEYFGKFYEDGGKPFKPLKINTTYFDPAGQGQS